MRFDCRDVMKPGSVVRYSTRRRSPHGRFPPRARTVGCDERYDKRREEISRTGKAIQIGRAPLCANMTETTAHPRFSVEGEGMNLSDGTDEQQSDRRSGGEPGAERRAPLARRGQGP